MRINAIASATRERQFAAHLINEDTEIIFLDEWTSDSLNAEDAKKSCPRSIEKLVDFITNLEFLSLLMSYKTLVKAQMVAQSVRGLLYLR